MSSFFPLIRPLRAVVRIGRYLYCASVYIVAPNEQTLTLNIYYPAFPVFSSSNAPTSTRTSQTGKAIVRSTSITLPSRIRNRQEGWRVRSCLLGGLIGAFSFARFLSLLLVVGCEILCLWLSGCGYMGSNICLCSPMHVRSYHSPSKAMSPLLAHSGKSFIFSRSRHPSKPYDASSFLNSYCLSGAK